jgi:zinc protease
MRPYWAVLICGTAAFSALAQTGTSRQESMKGVILKHEAPVSKEVLKVRLPRPADRTLKNGLAVLVIENHRLPEMSLDLVLPGASALSDPAGLEGLADCTAAMLKAGTATRDSKAIAEALSEMGATLNISAAGESAHVRASALTGNTDAMLSLMADVLLNPTFPQDELDKWKIRMLGRLQQELASPGFLGNERLHQVLYAGDARMVVSPSADSIRKITRDDVVAFYKAHYKPGNALMGITGDVRTDAIRKRLDTLLAKWESGDAAEPKLPLLAPIAAKAIYLVNRPHSVQTYLILANRAIARTDPDYVACQVLNQILGAGPASRLFRNIREDKGYTYGVYSSFDATRFTNHFAAASSVRTPVTGPAIDEFLKEFRDIRERPVPEEELDTAKRAIVAGFALGLERESAVLERLLTIREYGLAPDYWDTYPAKVMAVTAADVERVAKKYIPVNDLQLVAVGDGATIRPVLEKYGPVTEYSADGKKID